MIAFGRWIRVKEVPQLLKARVTVRIPRAVEAEALTRRLRGPEYGAHRRVADADVGGR